MLKRKRLELVDLKKEARAKINKLEGDITKYKEELTLVDVALAIENVTEHPDVDMLVVFDSRLLPDVRKLVDLNKYTTGPGAKFSLRENGLGFGFAYWYDPDNPDEDSCVIMEPYDATIQLDGASAGLNFESETELDVFASVDKTIAVASFVSARGLTEKNVYSSAWVGSKLVELLMKKEIIGFGKTELLQTR
jgi:hypothetical protein